MIFSFHNNNISITDQGKALPELRSIKDKKNFRDIVEYVYWNYDRNSIYHGILIQDRLKIVHSDKFNHLDNTGYENLANDSVELIGKFNMIQFTQNELLLDGMNRKIGEYLEFWNRTKIEEDNHKLISDTIERAEVLLKMKEKLISIVNKENSTRRMGKGAGSAIENMED